MASNRPALDEAPYGPSGYGPTPAPGTLPFGAVPVPDPDSDADGGFPCGPGGSPRGSWDERGPREERGAWEEWNPTEDSIAPVRGKHRVVKQRGGTMARSGAVLGVGVIAAVGAGGMASAKDRPATPISVPDLAHLADQVQDQLPDAKDVPGIRALVSDSSSDSSGSAEAAPFPGVGVSAEDAANGTTDAGEALRARILQQAEFQQSAVDDAKRAAAADVAEKQAAQAAAEKKATEAKKKKEAEEAAARKAEAERLAKLAASYTLPVSSYTLTAGFGQAGDLWSADHTGQDFAAPTGTPVKAVHGGTITEAGWAGSYGYRIVLTLDDGTELWFCHLSSMVQTSGEVTTGEVIGRVGATGNVTGPHLHLEVRPGGGDPIDPMPWLHQHGQNP